MSMAIDRIRSPELFFGFVSPIGANLIPAVTSFRKHLEGMGYDVVEIKVTDVFTILEKYIASATLLSRSPSLDRYTSYIKYGNQLRAAFDDDAILAASAIVQTIRLRNRLQRNRSEKVHTKTAFLLHQFKRKEEIDLLRSVYGRLFFQVSIYSRRGARVDFLSRTFASSAAQSGHQMFRDR